MPICKNRQSVPRGTKLGPVLFLVMINNINYLELRSANINHLKHVDDVTISESLSIHELPTLQFQLDVIHS